MCIRDRPWRKPPRTTASGCPQQADTQYRLSEDFFCDLNFQGRQIRRPMYVLHGLARHKAILGINYGKEQHLAIDGSGPHFTEASKLLPDDICTMFTQSEVGVPPRTIRRLTVSPKASSGLKCPPGRTGVVSSDTDDYGIWDAACMV